MHADFTLLFMVGDPVPEPSEALPRFIEVDEPDAGLPTARVGVASDHPLVGDGADARLVMGLMMGIVPHILCDGWVNTVESTGTGAVLHVTDRLADLGDKRLPAHCASLREQLDAHVRSTLGCGVAWLEAASGPARDPDEEESTLTHVLKERGWMVRWRDGGAGLGRDVAIGPLAMRRTTMLPFSGRDCLHKRFFSPAPNVQAAELRVRATSDCRAVISGVHTLRSFGEHDGQWYCSHIVHHLQPDSYEQTVSLVRVGA